MFWLTELLNHDRVNTELDQVRAQARPNRKNKQNSEFLSIARKAKAAKKAAAKAPVWVNQETFPALKPSSKAPQVQNPTTKSASSAGLVWDAPQNATKSADVVAETEVKQIVSKKGGRKKKWMPVSLKNTL